jgi:DNA adenine methylase
VIAHPFIKFVGGKTALLPEILRRLPAKMNTYYEPFLGGGAAFFALAAEGRFKRAVIGDANEELMNVYSMIRKSPKELMWYFEGPGFNQDEHSYYNIRSQDPTKLKPMARAARTLYLNKVGFNGLYRVNKKGVFNVPWGRQEGRGIFEEENILACSKALQQAQLVAVDFEQAIAGAKRGDVVFADPPYIPVSATADFTAYTKAGFTFDDQTRLRDVGLKLKRRGVHILFCNSDTPLVRRLYSKGFKLHSVSAPRNVNSKATGRGLVGELLLT